MSLYEDLTRIGQQVAGQLRQMKNNEGATIQVSVLPFIRALGYSTQYLSEVYPQYSILNMDAVDYAVLRDGEPIMFLEAKKAGENLSAKHWKQLFEYFNADKARIGILTNGIEYRFYTDSVKQNIMDDEPSLIINLCDLDKVSVAQLDGFTKARFHPEHSLRKIKISNLLSKEMDQPSDEFVRYFAKQVHSGSLWQTVIEEFRPILKQAWRGLIENELASGIKPVTASHGIKQIDPPLPPDSNDIVEISVFRKYYDQRFEGTLLFHKSSRLGDFDSMIMSKVRFDGDTVSLTLAAKRAVRQVNPTVGGPNGWDWWKLKDPASGKERIVNELLKDETLRKQFVGNG